MQNASTTWYQHQMRQVLAEIELIEQGLFHGDSVGQRYFQLQGQLTYLLSKGIFERKLLSKLYIALKNC